MISTVEASASLNDTAGLEDIATMQSFPSLVVSGKTRSALDLAGDDDLF